MRKGKSNLGITLVALMVTIVVLLILVALSIDVLINGEIFDQTQTVINDANSIITQEENMKNELMTNINRTPGKPIKGGTSDTQ